MSDLVCERCVYTDWCKLCERDDRIKELEEELASETRWAKEYSDDLLKANARVKELEAANEVLAYNLTDDVQRIREYKNEWELCCERERARWEMEKELNARVKELEKWRDAVLSIVDGLDDPHRGVSWHGVTQELCARELERVRSVLVPLVRGEGGEDE